MIILTILGIAVIVELLIFVFYLDCLGYEMHHKRYWRYSEINRYIFSLPIKDIPPKEEIYNKHLQNLVWAFWFGKELHEVKGRIE